MIRMFDFDCATHGLFEGMVTEDEQVLSAPCPQCGEEAPQVWRRSPSMQPGDVHAVQLGGRTFRRDDIEQFLDAPASKEPSFFETEKFATDFHERLSRNAAKEVNGELAPQVAPAVTADQEKEIARVTENVDTALVGASQNAFVDTFRKTDFKE